MVLQWSFALKVCHGICVVARGAHCSLKQWDYLSFLWFFSHWLKCLFRKIFITNNKKQFLKQPFESDSKRHQLLCMQLFYVRKGKPQTHVLAVVHVIL